ncbi:unnamed protein product [Gulo gulo]|uniref:Uncharacterized protein n=1 Tax=Gulo gulo TaxID=48420 RepID=A0A9X9M0K8_GULGU|nr:unnamed protein product [Gulo gulo]
MRGRAQKRVQRAVGGEIISGYPLPWEDRVQRSASWLVTMVAWDSKLYPNQERQETVIETVDLCHTQRTLQEDDSKYKRRAKPKGRGCWTVLGALFKE